MASDIYENFHHTIGESTYCDAHATDLKYWIPITLNNYSDGEYHWSSHADLDNKFDIKELNYILSDVVITAALIPCNNSFGCLIANICQAFLRLSYPPDGTIRQ